MTPKGKPRGRKGGRKPSPCSLVRLTVHVPPELRDWLKSRGGVAGQVRAALERYQREERKAAGLCPKCGRPLHRFHDCELNPVARPGQTEG